MKPRIFGLFFSLFVISLLAQNCGMPARIVFENSNQTNTSQQQGSLSSARGGGDGYDGKPSPGDYDRTFPNFNCPNSVDPMVQSKMHITDTEAHITNDNCKATTYQTEFTNPELSFSGYNNDYLNYAKSIFERKTDSTLHESATEVFCQYNDGLNGFDVVIKQSKTKNYKAKIYLGKRLNSASVWNSEIVSDFSVNSSALNGLTEYYSTSQAFSLKVSTNSNGDNIFQGNLSANINNQDYKHTSSCRRMSSMPTFNININELFAYYKINNSQNIIVGNDLLDSSGRGFYAKSQNYAASFVPGIIGNAVPLNLSTQVGDPYFYIAGSPNPSNRASISFWYYQTAFDTSGNNRILDWWAASGGPVMSLGVSIGNISQGLMIYTSSYSIATGFMPTLNQWHHVVIVYNGTNIITFVDGLRVNIAPQQNPSTDIIGSHFYLSLGNLGGSAVPARLNNSKIDEISLWARDLTDQEVSAIFSNYTIF